MVRQHPGRPRAAGLLVLSCFLLRSIPMVWILYVIKKLGWCEGGDGERVAWLALLQTHWLAELVPVTAMLLLPRFLERLKLSDTGYRSQTFSQERLSRLLPPTGVLGQFDSFRSDADLEEASGRRPSRSVSLSGASFDLFASQPRLRLRSSSYTSPPVNSPIISPSPSCLCADGQPFAARTSSAGSSEATAGKAAAPAAGCGDRAAAANHAARSWEVAGCALTTRSRRVCVAVRGACATPAA